jgi:hypothetical protein
MLYLLLLVSLSPISSLIHNSRFAIQEKLSNSFILNHGELNGLQGTAEQRPHHMWKRKIY